MVGLGETREEIMQVMDDLRAADVDFLTIGQYLQPTRKHAPSTASGTPEEFAGLEADRARQGLPDGVGEPADAFVLSRRYGFRGAEGRALERNRVKCAAVHPKNCATIKESRA